MSNRELTILERLEARRLAKEAWILSSRDPVVAREMASELARQKGIDPALIAIFVNIAIELFKWWLENREQDTNG